MSNVNEWIENGTIVFVRNNNEKISLLCKVNMTTLEVFDFDMTKVFNSELRTMKEEYLIIKDTIWNVYGASHPLFLSDDETDFWYNDLQNPALTA